MRRISKGFKQDIAKKQKEADRQKKRIEAEKDEALRQEIYDALEKIFHQPVSEWYMERAEKGDEYCQLRLGDVYFYGINADEQYWRTLDDALKYNSFALKGNFRAFSIKCVCDKEPDYDEALKWYNKAAHSGNKEALAKIDQIKNQTVKRPERDFEQTVTFKYDYDSDLQENMTTVSKTGRSPSRIESSITRI